MLRRQVEGANARMFISAIWSLLGCVRPPSKQAWLIKATLRLASERRCSIQQVPVITDIRNEQGLFTRFCFKYKKGEKSAHQYPYSRATGGKAKRMSTLLESLSKHFGALHAGNHNPLPTLEFASLGMWSAKPVSLVTATACELL